MNLLNWPEFYKADAIKQVTCFRQTKKYKAVNSFIQNSTLSSFNNNSYRILGLPTNASEKEVLERVNDLKMKSKLGLKQKPTFKTSLLGDIEIDDKTVLSASNRLRQPESRLYERLNWFSNINNWPVKDLAAEDVELNDYLDFFYKTVVPGAHAYSLNVLLDIALLGLLILHNDDYTLKHINTWANVYNLILYVYEQDDFWRTLDSIENDGGFIHSGKTVSTKKYKVKAIEKLLEPFLALLNRHFDEDLNSAENGLQIYSKLNLVEEIWQAYIRQIIDKLEDDISQAIDTGLQYCSENIKRDGYSLQNNEEICVAVYKEFYNDAGTKLKLFWKYTNNTPRIRRMKEKFADYLTTMAINFTWADNYIMAQNLLLNAKELIDAGTTEAVQIETMLNKIAQPVEFQESMGITVDSVGRKIDALTHDSNYKQCPYCKLDVPKAAILCRHCNATIVEKVKSQPTRVGSSTKPCPYCKLDVPKSAVLCRHCGATIVEKIQSQPYRSYSNGATRASDKVTARANKENYWLIGAVVAAIFIMLIFVIASDNNSGPNPTTPPKEERKIEKLEYTNAVYWGAVQNGKPHGQGTLTFNNGDKYVGAFVYGEYHGQGTFTWANGDRHTGSWANDDVSGYGTLYFNDGDSITGYWTDSLNATSARYHWRDGSFVSGAVRNGQFIEH